MPRHARIGFIYPDLMGEGGYPRDIRTLISAFERATNVEVVPIFASADAGPAVKAASIAVNLQRALPGLDAVHFFGFYFPVYPVLSRMVWARRLPYVASPLGALLPYGLRKSRLMKTLFIELWGKAFLARAARLQVFTDNEAASVRAIGVDARLAKHSLGLYLEDVLAPLPRPPLEEDYMFAYGRLDIYHKGIDVLIEGYARYVHEHRGPLRLVIAGRSWANSAPWIEARIRELDLADRVLFLGEVSQEEKLMWMGACKAFVYPTRFDGPPRPIREALSLDRRLLITHSANVHDDLERLGWGYLFEPTPAGLLAAILKLESERSAPPYADPRAILSWDRIAQEMEQTYMGMLGQLPKVASGMPKKGPDYADSLSS